MPNRWERINGVLTPKIATASVKPQAKAVIANYEHIDDFSHASSPTGSYAVSGTWSAVATGSNFVSGTVAGNSGGIRQPTGATVDPTKRLGMKFRASLTNADTELFAYLGAFETAPTDADPPVLANDYIGFELIETTLNSNWQAICGQDVGGAGAETTVDTGVVVDLNTPHDFEILLENSSAKFYIDGALVATIGTNLPLVGLVPTLKVTTGNTSAKGLTIDALQVTNTR